MICPRCQVPLSRHDNWCSKCNTYYDRNVAAPVANSTAPVSAPQTPWGNGAGHPAAAYSPLAYTGQPQPPASASNRSRMMIGGVSLGTIAIFLRGLNLIYHTQQNYADKAAQNARDQQNFQQAAGQGQAASDGGVGGFIQAHEASRAAIQNQQEQSRQQQQMVQTQMQQQAETTRQMQAQQAALRSMNQPTFSAPAPVMQPMQPIGQPGFSPRGPMGGGAHFGRP